MDTSASNNVFVKRIYHPPKLERAIEWQTYIQGMSLPAGPSIVPETLDINLSIPDIKF